MFELAIICVKRKYNAIESLFASLIASDANITHLISILRIELRNTQQ